MKPHKITITSLHSPRSHRTWLECSIFYMIHIKLAGKCSMSKNFEQFLEMFPKKKYTDQGSPGDLAVKCVPMQGNMGLIPGPGRSHMLQSYQAGVAQLWSPSCRVQKLQLLRLCSDARKPQMLSLRVTTTEAHTPRIHAPREK